MRIETLDALSPVSTRAVVVNLQTDHATTLAVASLRRHAPEARVLVVDLDPTEAGRAYFDRMAAAWDFDVFESHDRPHGDVLDEVVPRALADRVLLFDSDAELVDPNLFATLCDAVGASDVYAAGFEQRAAPLPPSYPGPATQLASRGWPVCLMLDGEAVRVACEEGASFYPLDDGETFFDTGALLCRALEQRGWRFVSLGDATTADRHLAHIGGWSWDRDTFSDAEHRNEVDARIRSRLAAHGFDAFDVEVNPLPLS
jgi:hypothetical protein